MWISDFAIRRPVITTVVVLALVVFGLIALRALDTDEFPEIEPPVVAVAAAYPGASPTVVEREVVEPLEEAFQSLSGVDEIRSTSLDGYAVLVVAFDFEVGVQQATQDIRDKVSEIRADLPPEMEEPVLTRFDPQDLPIVSLTLSSERLDPAALTRLADPGVTGALESLPGVANVDVVGGLERELTIELRPRALEATGIGVAQVVRAVEASNLAVPVGRLTGPTSERTIRLRGRLSGPEQFARLVVGSQDGRLVRLGELAEVRDAAEEPRSAAFFDGRRAVGIDVVKATGYSTTAVSEAIVARAAELRAGLPEGVRLDVVRDAGERVARSVADVEASLVEGGLLTVLVVFLFLRSWRSTIITGLALPVSVLSSFIAVWAFGFTLNTMSLLGLSLAIGILIDDALVVRENIVRHLERGADHVRAAAEGTAEIGLAVAATTFAIVVVFVPVAFMGGIAEQWFAPFALTIACSVLVSLFVSFTLDPMLSAAWPDPEASGRRRSWLARRLAVVERALDRTVTAYQRVIRWALRHRLATVAVAGAAFASALAMPATGLIGSAFFPDQDRSELTFRIETPPGSSLGYTSARLLGAAAAARRYPEVAYTYATAGGEGKGVDEATLYVRLVPRAERAAHQDEVARALRADLRRLAGLTAYSTSGMGNERQIQVELTGPDLEVLGGLAERAAARVAQVPGAVDVSLSSRGQRPEVEIVIDRELAGDLGVTAADIAAALRPAFAGVDAGDWVDPTGETRDVTVRLAPRWRERPDDLERLPLVVAGPAGPARVPLGQLADLEHGLGPTQVEHLDGERVITVSANAEDRPLSAVVADIDAALAGLGLPAGYARGQGGETEDQREVFGRILSALAIAVVLMYFVLVILFGSFLAPIPIMASLPLSLIGVMLALLVTGGTLNIMSLIGVLLLMGLVAKNAILLIDFARDGERAGRPRREALVEAGGVRFRPVIMTSVAIIAGMTPVALGTGEGSEFRAPLGRAVIGGVITSTLLTLLVIPTFYDILAGWRDRLGRVVRRRRSG